MKAHKDDVNYELHLLNDLVYISVIWNSERTVAYRPGIKIFLQNVSNSSLFCFSCIVVQRSAASARRCWRLNNACIRFIRFTLPDFPGKNFPQMVVKTNSQLLMALTVYCFSAPYPWSQSVLLFYVVRFIKHVVWHIALPLALQLMFPWPSTLLDPSSTIFGKNLLLW